MIPYTAAGSKFTINALPIGTAAGQIPTEVGTGPWYTIAEAGDYTNGVLSGLPAFDANAFVLPTGYDIRLEDIGTAGASATLGNGYAIQVQVPEPGSVGLVMAASAMGLLGRRRRRNAAKAC